MANDIQSPTLFVLSSNNDQLERAQARAARAAANRRKAATVVELTGLPSPPGDTCLSEEQVVELFQRCIKLASENKINQKNSWELKLIDHLSDIIKVEAGNDSETNFQKASCTLEAGVKIYSVRVDSVHAEAYKVLGRINRAGLEDDQETIMEDGNVNDGQDKSRCKKEPERKISPLSTLEASFEALNLKKFDVAFVVDPLYHQTSAQFDEGGAKGLLLNNLGIYGGCQVLFDSSEIPEKCRSCSLKNNALDLIDLSLEKESIEQMVINMLAKNEISPTLKEILAILMKIISNQHKLLIYARTQIIIQQEDNNSHASHEADMDDRFEKVSAFLFQGLAIASKKNAWAGPDHWKFWRPKGSEDAPATPIRPTNKGSKDKNHTQPSS
ncbi:hypothetical protein M0R45_015342 [Rubus argutus]|uniref:Condensin complex subunit 2 n=1 Tax=Rubus argutus TaxID=59490 RepID=A0AAW1XQE2_RUBAR